MFLSDLPVQAKPGVLTAGGIDVLLSFRLGLASWTETPPEPKTVLVEVPGRDGDIDLTESLTGDVAYSGRSMDFDLWRVESARDHAETKRRLYNALHGRRLKFQLGWDPGYTYDGRFSVSAWEDDEEEPGLRWVRLHVDCDPYKSKGLQTYSLNAVGGKWFHLPSGRKRVHPTIECKQPVRVTFGGGTTTVGAGTWRLNDVLFAEGVNDLYINSWDVFWTTWGDLAEGETGQLRWAGAGSMTWDALMGRGSDVEVSRTWDGVAERRWDDVAEVTWSGLVAPEDPNGATPVDTNVYLQYEWKDL